MKITVLGNCGPYPGPGGACSGYLLEEKDTKILIDCGNGTLGRLQQFISGFQELDMVILSHLHSDHMADAMVLRYAMGIQKMKGLLRKNIALYAPASPKEDFEKLQFQNAFDLKEISQGLTLNVDGLEISFQQMDHPVPCYGIAFQNKDRKFVYSGDTKYCQQILKFAKDADLFLCECGVLEKDKTATTAHLSAKEAGEIATKANVKTLLLTHFWPEYKLHEIEEEARRSFAGELILSQQMKTYPV